MPRLTITLPQDVYDRIKEQAERDFRTVGAEIAYLLNLQRFSQSSQSSHSSLHYPEGVRSTENPVITNDYNSYYEESKHTPRRIIQ